MNPGPQKGQSVPNTHIGQLKHSSSRATFSGLSRHLHTHGTHRDTYTQTRIIFKNMKGIWEVLVGDLGTVSSVPTLPPIGPWHICWSCEGQPFILRTGGLETRGQHLWGTLELAPRSLLSSFSNPTSSTCWLMMKGTQNTQGSRRSLFASCALFWPGPKVQQRD